MNRILPLLTALLLAPLASLQAADVTKAKPNIIYILCDDLGYGDVKCLGGERSKIATPNMDRLAAGGMIFTEAHSGASVCTPSRYGIMTGRYSWRTHLQSGVLNGYGQPLIAKERLTVPALLKQHGYATACIGKWHLGMAMGEGNPSAPIGDGPTTRGFDYYFGISASLGSRPHAFIENDRFTEVPGRKGAAVRSFTTVGVLPTLGKKATAYITAQSKKSAPFFLYLPLNSPHGPIVPAEEWQGKSGINPYADFVMATDGVVGDVLAALDQAGIADNTLVFFTSDNGCSPQGTDVKQLESKGHFPSELRRGYKADVWDGGHRIPFIARWPGKIKAGSRTDQITCLNDLMATSAEIIGAKLPDDAGEDSVSILPDLLGTAKGPVREATIHQAPNSDLAIRQGPWKLIFLPNGKRELYNLQTDLSETSNVAEANPEVVERLGTLMRRYIDEGRSTAGAAQKNSAAFPLDASFSGKKKKGRKAEKKSAKEVALALDPQFD